jgi:hypothetical protein
MRIIINIDDVKDPDRPGRKTVRVRTGYQFSSDDPIRIMNCGVEIYDVIKEGFGSGFEGGLVIHEGERT